MAGYSGDHYQNHSSGKAGSLAVPPAGRPSGSRQGSHASRGSVDLTDGDGYYGQDANGEQDADVPLELDTFQASDFNVSRLVSSLTDSLIAKSKQGGGGEWKHGCHGTLALL